MYIAKEDCNLKEKDYNIIKIMKEPFPSIAHQSYWCFHYITNNYLIRIQDIVKNSINYWERELKDIKYLSSNDLWENRGILLKKLLVADYDNTLYTDEISILNNINKIKEFRNSGNYFAIATSRGYTSLISEIEKYKIPYDFICTNNGAVISNNNGKIIYKNFLDIEDFNKIEKILDKYCNIEITRYYLNSIKIQNKERITDNYDIIPEQIIGYKIKGNLGTLKVIKEELKTILNNFEITIKENKKLFLNFKENTKEKQ